MFSCQRVYYGININTHFDTSIVLSYYSYISTYITLTEPFCETPVSVMMTRHFMSCSFAYSYCSVRLGSGVGTNSA